MRSGRALARTSGVTPTTDDVGCLLLPTDVRVGRRAGNAMVTAVVRGGSISMRNAIILNLHQPHGKRRIPVYILNLHHALGQPARADALAPGRDARRSACAALVFRRALASWQAYQIVNSHTALPLILSQKGVDSQRAPFHHEEVAMSKRTFLAPGVVLGDWWHRTADGRLQCDLCPRGCTMRPGQHGFASCARRVRKGSC
jgi:hypothetical protein